MKGLITAQIATLVDKFGLTQDEILELTDRQIHEVYFHKRDKDGAIKVPEFIDNSPPEPMTIAKRLAALDTLLWNKTVNASQHADLRVQMIQKYGTPEEQALLLVPVAPVVKAPTKPSTTLKQSSKRRPKKGE